MNELVKNHTAGDNSTLGDILEIALRERAPPVEQVPSATPTVDRMLNVYDNQWSVTAEQCLLRAAELEAAADELRQRADKLYNARSYLDDVKQSVLFEIESRNRAASLALVNPSQE